MILRSGGEEGTECLEGESSANLSLPWIVLLASFDEAKVARIVDVVVVAGVGELIIVVIRILELCAVEYVEVVHLENKGDFISKGKLLSNVEL